MADDPMAAVRKYVNAFNRGDATAMATTFAGSGSILDGMAPHVWQGPTATQDWYKGVLVEASNMTFRIISSAWASPCTTSPGTAPTQSGAVLGVEFIEYKLRLLDLQMRAAARFCECEC